LTPRICLGFLCLFTDLVDIVEHETRTEGIRVRMGEFIGELVFAFFFFDVQEFTEVTGTFLNVRDPSRSVFRSDFAPVVDLSWITIREGSQVFFVGISTDGRGVFSFGSCTTCD
jgi:hypothetical protein